MKGHRRAPVLLRKSRKAKEPQWAAAVPGERFEVQRTGHTFPGHKRSEVLKSKGLATAGKERGGEEMKRLPIGIQDFKDLVESGYLYVDKTRFLVDLIEQGKVYFLSRPRR